MSDRNSISRFQHSYKGEVLFLLRLNTPLYFAPEEEKSFSSYLDNEAEFYYVIKRNGVILGCGGINYNAQKTIARISWDIIHPEWHRKNIGTELLQHRLDIIKSTKSVEQIVVRTSQHAYRFYERHDFRLLEVVKDFWAKGFDLYHMEYKSEIVPKS